MMVSLASLSAMGSVAVLRYSWGLPTRRSVLNGGGWALAVLAAILAWRANGAWGVAVASLWAMAAASLLLAYAAWQAPAPKPAKMRPSRQRSAQFAASGDTVDGDSLVAPFAAIANPSGNTITAPSRHIGRRLITFLLVAIVPIFLCVGVAAALRAILASAGWSEVNAIVAALSLMPLLWTWLCYDVLTKTRAAQLRTLAVYALPGLAMLIWGAMK
jgi:hypothetical protein